MKRVFLILMVCAIRASAVDLLPTPPFGDGTFVGMEPMPGYHDHPKDHWFHQNTLTIKGGDVTLNKVPVVYYNGKKGYSASDGGFYTYHGTIAFAAGAWHIELLRTESDYATVRVGKDEKPPRRNQSILQSPNRKLALYGLEESLTGGPSPSNRTA